MKKKKKQGRKKKSGGKKPQSRSPSDTKNSQTGNQEPKDFKQTSTPFNSFAPTFAEDEETEFWYDATDTNSRKAKETADVGACRKLADNLFEKHVRNQKKQSDQSRNFDFLKSVLSSGVMNDKIYSLSLMINQSPMTSLHLLDTLLSFAKKPKSELAIGALTDLFQSTLLPNRQLKPLEKQYFKKEKTEHDLILWHFEEQLKKRFVIFLSLLETGTQNTLLWYKRKMVNHVFALLNSKPEQEQILLSILANKLTDKDRSIVSKTVMLLKDLVFKNPLMKLVVAQEVERLIMRPNIDRRAQYNGTTFLNQITFTGDPHDARAAQKLINIYFGLFQRLVENRNSLNTKMLSSILTGVNRAFPYAPMSDEACDGHINELFRVVHSSSFNTTIQALMLLFQVMSARKSVSDRFYRALYSSLQNRELETSNKPQLYLNLLYKSLKSDTSTPRVAAFIKRLIQICLYQPPTFVCGALVVVSELIKHQKSILLLMNQPLKDSTISEHEGDQDDAKFQYDPQKRDPQFSNASNSCLWELHHLTHHFHPSVVKFASDILNQQSIVYSGDPLSDFKNTAFLDRFSYKNPKKNKNVRKTQTLERKSNYKLGVPVNSADFLNKNPDKLHETEKFYHKFFREKQQREKQFAKQKADGEQKTDQKNDPVGMEETEDEFAERLFEREMEKMNGPADIDDDDDLMPSDSDLESDSDGSTDSADGVDNKGSEDIGDSESGSDSDNDINERPPEFGDFEVDLGDDNEANSKLDLTDEQRLEQMFAEQSSDESDSDMEPDALNTAQNEDLITPAPTKSPFAAAEAFIDQILDHSKKEATKEAKTDGTKANRKKRKQSGKTNSPAKRKKK